MQRVKVNQMNSVYMKLLCTPCTKSVSKYMWETESDAKASLHTCTSHAYRKTCLCCCAACLCGAWESNWERRSRREYPIGMLISTSARIHPLRHWNPFLNSSNRTPVSPTHHMHYTKCLYIPLIL